MSDAYKAIAKEKAARKILICTEREFFEHFRDDAKGLVPDDIEIVLIEVE